MDNSANQILQLILQKYHMNLLAYDEDYLMKTIHKRMAFLQYKSFDEYLLEITYNQGEVHTLSDALNINYSQFFREQQGFFALEQVVMPSLFSQNKNNREIRIWSVGCSTGQEAYSVAILLHHYSVLTGKKFRYRIFASDISISSLEYAKRGIYNEHEVESIRYEFIKKYFVKIENTYHILQEIKDHITFLEYDLLDTKTRIPTESIYGEFDIVLCNNILYYYRDEFQKIIINKLVKSLSPIGFLITTKSEKMIVSKNVELKNINVESSVFRK
ncbi:MAG: hypothetical protein PHC62_05535 [Candidatus Izemoplasmatales bacterium]|jgi:chemotaxis methyl-accepting protein methylase|nr:hypothetical protein [Candidatus Izemoplasmatales bacterium]